MQNEEIGCRKRSRDLEEHLLAAADVDDPRMHDRDATLSEYRQPGRRYRSRVIRATDPWIISTRRSVVLALGVLALTTTSIAWLPSDGPWSVSALLVTTAIVTLLLVMLRRRPPLVGAPLLLAIGFASEAVYANDPLGYAVARSSLAALLLYALTIAVDVAIGRRIVFWTTLGGCVLFAITILALWAIEPYPKTTVTNEWLHALLHPWASATWSVRTDFLSLNTEIPPLLFLVSFGLATALRASRRRAGAWLATMAVMVAIAACGSRAGLIAAGAAIVTVGVLGAAGRGPRAGWLALTGAAGIVVGALSGLADPSSLGSRAELWQVSLDALRAHVPFGVGPGGYPALFAHTFAPTAIDRRVPVAPHELLLDVWGNAGIIGLAAVALTVVFVWRAARRDTWTMWSLGAAAVLASTIVFGLFESDLGVIYQTADGSFAYLASPLPWIALALFATDGAE